jgi:hypothetical protein
MPQQSQYASINQVLGIEEQGDYEAEPMEVEGNEPDQDEVQEVPRNESSHQ